MPASLVPSTSGLSLTISPKNTTLCHVLRWQPHILSGCSSSLLSVPIAYPGVLFQTEKVSLSAYSGKHSVPILMSCYDYPQDTTQRQIVRQNKRIRSLNATWDPMSTISKMTGSNSFLWQSSRRTTPSLIPLACHCSLPTKSSIHSSASHPWVKPATKMLWKSLEK